MKSIASSAIAIVLFVVLSLSGAGCKKHKVPPAVLPQATQEGKNTIGFKVNGEIWVPFYPCSYSGDPCGEISARYGLPDNSPDHFEFQVARRISTNRHSSFSFLGFEEITTTGDKYNFAEIEFRGENSIGNTDIWGKSLTGPPGTFEITKIDKVNQIISGIFSFTLYEKSGSGRTLEITEGRFDFKMNACICRQ